MYINISETLKCSKCGAINCTELISRDNKMFRRCRLCGHEKLYSTTTVFPSSIKYESIPNKEIIF